MPMWLFRSSKHDGGLWRCHLVTLLCSSISPSATTHDETIEQWVQEFQVGYWLAWLPLCFEIAIYAQREHTAECIWYKCDTLFLEQLEKSTLLRNELIGQGQNRRWTVKFCKGGGGSFENCRWHADDINIDFHLLRGKRTLWWGDSTQLASNVKTKKKSKQFFPRNAEAYFSAADSIFLSWFSSRIRYVLSFQSSFFALR